MANRPPVVAHRGNAGEFPENTLPALKSAVALGAPFIEFDVQLSSDGVPMVIHDADLERTAGLPYSVLDSPAAELAVRSVHEPARFGDRYAGICIPSLRDAAAFLRGSRGVTAFVELKRASIARHGLEKAVDAVVDVIEAQREESVFISFSPEAVMHARARGLRIGAILEGYDEANRLRMHDLVPDFVFCNVSRLPPGEGARWQGPWQWVLYEVGTYALAQRLQARGAHLVETMEVASMIASFRGSGGP